MVAPGSTSFEAVLGHHTLEIIFEDVFEDKRVVRTSDGSRRGHYELRGGHDLFDPKTSALIHWEGEEESDDEFHQDHRAAEFKVGPPSWRLKNKPGLAFTPGHCAKPTFADE